jgi:Protein of unknown function (DUF1493)
MSMENQTLPEVMRQYLIHCGLSAAKIAQCNMHTRLCHDLGIYGEAAEDYLEVLRQKYQVDLSNFEFAEYFPAEYPYRTFVEKIIFDFQPFGRWLASRKDSWQPLTLAMINAAISAKKWHKS